MESRPRKHAISAGHHQKRRRQTGSDCRDARVRPCGATRLSRGPGSPPFDRGTAVARTGPVSRDDGVVKKTGRPEDRVCRIDATRPARLTKYDRGRTDGCRPARGVMVCPSRSGVSHGQGNELHLIAGLQADQHVVFTCRLGVVQRAAHVTHARDGLAADIEDHVANP